jgi:hypothetical protein
LIAFPPNARPAAPVLIVDQNVPYSYLGLYVETISDAPSTAAAEFDNFTAAQIRG